MEPSILEREAQRATPNNTNQQADKGGQTFANAVAQPLQKAQEAVTGAIEAAGLTGTVEKAKETATNVVHNVQDAASYVGQKAESATTSVGSALENTGHYLKEDGLRNIATDVTELVRRNPIPALLVGIGFGFLLAQASAPRRVA